MRHLFCTLLWWLARKSAVLALWVERPKDVAWKVYVEGLVFHGGYRLKDGRVLPTRTVRWTPR